MFRNTRVHWTIRNDYDVQPRRFDSSQICPYMQRLLWCFDCKIRNSQILTGPAAIIAAQRQRICRESRKGRSSLLKHGKKTFLIPINLKLTMNFRPPIKIILKNNNFPYLTSSHRQLKFCQHVIRVCQSGMYK